jgi:uncharacterized ferritin-like protein (DUF455 family)
MAERDDLFGRVRAVLDTADPAAKGAGAQALREDWRRGRLALAGNAPVEPIGSPGRPARPVLVPPRELRRRRLGSAEGRAALVHAVAHIEFNAINLALDAVYRFRGLPEDYYADWLRVAEDEARHFRMLEIRLEEMGFAYGDFPAHNGLWEMAEETAHDHLVRMALVPRVLEARGLDVTPGMIERLEAVGDRETVDCLKTILEEEVAHVAIGTHWFRWACRGRGLDPEPTFRDLLARYLRGSLKGPFNVTARRRAGFTQRELDELAVLAADGPPGSRG